MFRVLSRIGRGKYDLRACWDTLAALEKANELKLSDCPGGGGERHGGAGRGTASPTMCWPGSMR